MNLRCIAALLCSQALLLADGGRMLFQRTANGLIVTLFASPSPLRVGESDFSVFVEDAASSEPVLDAAVQITLTAPDRSQQRALLDHANATNRLLYAGQLVTTRDGEYSLLLDVRTRSGSAHLSDNVRILPAARGLQTYWPYLTPVPLAIGLFAINRLLRHANRQSG